MPTGEGRRAAGGGERNFTRTPRVHRRTRRAGYPTEDEIGRALPTFTSWTQVKNSLPKPPPEKPKPPTPPKPKPEPKWKNPELHDAIKDGATVTELKTQFDISDSTIGEARRFLEGQAEPVIVDYNTLPRSAEHRVDVLRRQIRRELEDEFEPKVRAEVQRRLDKAFDRVAEQYDRIQRFESAQRHGVFTKSDYNLIKSCLHPDSRASVSDEKLANAFRLFNQADIKLVPPSKPGDLPSLDELRRRRQADKR